MLEVFILNASYIFIVFFMLPKVLHIYQLESYSYKKNYFWLKSNFSYVFNKYILFNIFLFFINFIFMLILSELFYLLFFYILFLPTYVYVTATTEKKVYKTPLKYTKRIIRFIIIFIVFYLLIFNMGLINLVNIKLIYALLPLNFTLVLFVFIVSHLISYIIELVIAKVYLQLAKNKLMKSNILKTVGITGSYGKTSVKNFVHTILSEKYNALSTPKSYNTTMGIVRTIRENLNFQHKIFVVEMGADKAGDIKDLCEIVYPEVGVLVSIGKQHLNTFKFFDNIIRTKSELPNYINNSNGVMIFNLDDNNVHKIFSKFNLKKYGVCIDVNNHDNLKQNFFVNNTFILSTNNLQLDEKGSTFEILVNDKYFLTAETVLLGRHNVINILLAVAVCIELGLDEKEIMIGIKKLKAVSNRLEIKKMANGAILIDNGFNSNPTSAQVSLDVLSLFKNKNKIIITPGMVELANEQYTENYIFGGKIAKFADRAIVVNNVNKNALTAGLIDGGLDKNKILYFDNFNNSLIEYLKTLSDNDVVLIENDLPDNYI